MDLANIPAWLAEQRATAKVQAERWQGVDPSRLIEACDLVEELYATAQAQHRNLVQPPLCVPPPVEPIDSPDRALEIAEALLRQTWGGVGYEQAERSIHERSFHWPPRDTIDRIGEAQAQRPRGTLDRGAVPLIVLHAERTRYSFMAQQRDYIIQPGTGLLRIEAVLHAGDEERAFDNLLRLIPHAQIVPR